MKPAVRFAKTVDGGSVAYTTSGTGYPYLLLDLTSRNDVAREWDFPTFRRRLDAYARYFTLIRIEPRGLPNSDPVPSGRKFSDYVLDDIDAVVDALSLRAMAFETSGWLVGVGARYAARRPSLVTHCILFNPYFQLETQERMVRAHLGNQGNLQALAELAGVDRATFEATGWLQPNPDPAEVDMLADVLRRHYASPKSLALWVAARGTNELDDLTPWLQHLPSQTLVISSVPMFDSDAQALTAGVAGAMLVKREHNPKLEAGSAASAGAAARDEHDAEALARFVHGPDFSPVAPRATDIANALTARELEVLGLIAAGHNNPEIGESLVLSPSTVSRHVANIYAKLGIHNRAQATAAYFGVASDGGT